MKLPSRYQINDVVSVNYSFHRVPMNMTVEEVIFSESTVSYKLRRPDGNTHVVSSAYVDDAKLGPALTVVKP